MTFQCLDLYGSPAPMFMLAPNTDLESSLSSQTTTRATSSASIISHPLFFQSSNCASLPAVNCFNIGVWVDAIVCTFRDPINAKLGSLTTYLAIRNSPESQISGSPWPRSA